MAVIHLAELTDAERDERIGKLPVWAREYVEELRADIEELEDDLYAQEQAEDLDVALAASWRNLAHMRAQSGDQAGARRALFASVVFAGQIRC